MPPKTSSGVTTGSLTERDQQAIFAAFKCNKNAFDLDFQAYATMLGLANAASGKTSWYNLKKKLNLSTDSKGSDTTPKKRKASEAEDDDADGASDDGDEEEVAKPSKKKTKAAKSAKKGKKAAAEVKDEDEDDD